MTSGDSSNPPRLSYLAAASTAPSSHSSSCNDSNAAAGAATTAVAPSARLSRQQQAALDIDLRRGTAAGMQADMLAELRLMTPRTRSEILSAAESELRAARRVQEQHDRRLAQEVHDRDVAAAMASAEKARQRRTDDDARLARELAAADAAEARAAVQARAAAMRALADADADAAAGPRPPASEAAAAGRAARLFPSMAAGARAQPRFTSAASHLVGGSDDEDDLDEFFDADDAAYDAYDNVVARGRRAHPTRGRNAATGGAGRARAGQSPSLAASNPQGRVPFEMAGLGLASGPAAPQRRGTHHQAGAHAGPSAPRVSSTALTNAVTARVGAASNAVAATAAASARAAQRQQRPRDWRSEYEAAVIQRHLEERAAAGWHGGAGGPAIAVNPRHAALLQRQNAMLGARDVDRMSFEGLMELCERNGDVPTGLSEHQLARALEPVDIAALERMRAESIGSGAFSGVGGPQHPGATPSDFGSLGVAAGASVPPPPPERQSAPPVFVVEDDLDGAHDDVDVLDVDAASARPSSSFGAVAQPPPAPPAATAIRPAVAETTAPDLTCGVCLMDLTQPSGLAPDEAGPPMRIRLCGHTFHAACIKPWLLSQPRCPICRLEL